MAKMSAYWRLVVAFLLMVSSSATALAKKPEPITVRWGGTVSIELETPLFVAISQGYLADEGLKLESPMMGPGPRVREALAAGELDLADVGTFTYIVGRQAGLKQRIVFEYYTKEIFSLFASSKMQDKIKTVADLKGQRIITSALGSSSHMAGLAFLEKAGLKGADVSFGGLGSADPATMITAMESGQFAGGVFWEPTSTFLIDRKVAFPLIDIRDPAAHEKWIGKNASSMVLAVSEDLLAKRPEVVERAVRALKKATNFIQTHSAREVAAATASQFKMDPEVLTKILEPIKANFSRDGSLSKSGLDVEVDLAFGGGAIKKKLTFDEMVDTKFAGRRD